MTSKILPALVLGASVALGTLVTAGASEAADLHKSAKAHQTAQKHGASKQFGSGKRRTRGVSAASQDYTSECNLYGGGASTDPDLGPVCTTPDGETIIVPFP